MIIESSSSEISLAADRIRENISSEEEQVQYYMTNVFNMILNQSSQQIREVKILYHLLLIIANFLNG